MNDAAIKLGQLRRDRADTATTDGTAIDLGNGSDLGRRSG
jgi:hypothetical protein